MQEGAARSVDGDASPALASSPIGRPGASSSRRQDRSAHCGEAHHPVGQRPRPAILLDVEMLVSVLSGAAAFIGLGRVEHVLRAQRRVARDAAVAGERRTTDRNYSDDEAMGYRVAVGEKPEDVVLRQPRPVGNARDAASGGRSTTSQ